MSFSRNSRRVAFDGIFSGAVVFDLEKLERIYESNDMHDDPDQASFSPDGESLLIVSAHHAARIHHLTDKSARTVIGRGGAVTDAYASTRFDTFVLVMGDGSLLFGDARAPDRARSVRADNAKAVGVAICETQGSTTVVAAFDDSTIRTWDAARPDATPVTRATHDNVISSLSCARDARRVVSGSA